MALRFQFSKWKTDTSSKQWITLKRKIDHIKRKIEIGMNDMEMKKERHENLGTFFFKKEIKKGH